MRIELAALHSEWLNELQVLLFEEGKRCGLTSPRFDLGCRLVRAVELAWPPELADEAEVRWLVHRVKAFLASGEQWRT